MLAKILPILFLLVGVGGGIGAGLFLTPSSHSQSAGEHNVSGASQEETKQPNESGMDSHGNPLDPSASEFIRMSNQFVIPVVKKDMIAALVVVSLSLETRLGVSEEIYEREPKLRDAFLRVLFDHANMGGFHGAFTNAETMGILRNGLREVAQREFGPDVLDVLIVDIIRQDT